MLINDYTLLLQNINSLDSGHRIPFPSVQPGFKEKNKPTAKQQVLSQQIFPPYIDQTPSSHSSDLNKEWSGRSDTEVNATRLFWRCQEHKAKALLSVVTTVAAEEGGSLSTRLLLLCLGTAWGLSCPSALPWIFATPHVFPLKAWTQNNSEHLQNSQPGSALPGAHRAGSSGHGSAASKARRGEHSALLSTIWWHLGHGHTCSHLHLRLLLQGGQELPYPTNCSSCCLPFQFLTTVLQCQSLTWFFRVGGVGKSTSALVNTCLAPASPLFEICSIS